MTSPITGTALLVLNFLRADRTRWFTCREVDDAITQQHGDLDVLTALCGLASYGHVEEGRSPVTGHMMWRAEAP